VLTGGKPVKSPSVLLSMVLLLFFTGNKKPQK